MADDKDQIKSLEDEGFKKQTEEEMRRLWDEIHKLKQPYHGIGPQPLVDINFDQHFDYEIIDGKVTVTLDIESLQEQMPPLPNDQVDRYRHCTAPQTYPDIFLASDYATGIIEAKGEVASIVIKVTTANGGELCYYLVERGTTGIISNVTVTSVLDTCEECEDTPTSGDTGDPNTPYWSGEIVTDVDCANDGSGDLIITYYNFFTKAFTQSRKTGCCCDSGDSGGDSGDTLDRWEACDSGPADIYLSPVVYDAVDWNDPIIQLEGGSNGCCYQLAERNTTGNLETDYTGIIYRDGCTDAACDDCDVPPSCPYANTSEGPQNLTFAISGWDGNATETFGSTTEAAVTASTANCTVGSTTAYDQIVDRETGTGNWSPNCFWRERTAESAEETWGSSYWIKNAVNNDFLCGYNTAGSLWVVGVRVYVDDGSSCVGWNVYWVKDWGTTPVGTYRPATAAEVTTMFGASTTAAAPSGGTITITS